MTCKWAGTDDVEAWTLEIQMDRMDVNEPCVVTLLSRYHDGTDDHEALLWATPEQAREMAEALRAYADQAEAFDG